MEVHGREAEEQWWLATRYSEGSPGESEVVFMSFC